MGTQRAIQQSLQKKGIHISDEQLKQAFIESVFEDQQLHNNLLVEEEKANKKIDLLLTLTTALERNSSPRVEKLKKLMQLIDEKKKDAKQANQEYQLLDDEQRKEESSVADAGDECSKIWQSLNAQWKKFYNPILKEKHKQHSDTFYKTQFSLNQALKKISDKTELVFKECLGKIKKLEEVAMETPPQTPEKQFRALKIDETPTSTPEKTPPQKPRPDTPHSSRNLFASSSSSSSSSSSTTTSSGLSDELSEVFYEDDEIEKAKKCSMM